MEQNPSSCRADRKTIEKNRRNHMKALFSKLDSLVPHQTSRECASVSDRLDEAVCYIKKLQDNLRNLKDKRGKLMGIEKPTARLSRGTMAGLTSPHMEIHEIGQALDVNITTGLDCQFMFSEAVRIIHEEGAEVVNACFSVHNDTVFHTIHTKVGEFGAARISERLRKFVHGDTSFHM